MLKKYCVYRRSACCQSDATAQQHGPSRDGGANDRARQGGREAGAAAPCSCGKETGWGTPCTAVTVVYNACNIKRQERRLLRCSTNRERKLSTSAEAGLRTQRAGQGRLRTLTQMLVMIVGRAGWPFGGRGGGRRAGGRSACWMLAGRLDRQHAERRYTRRSPALAPNAVQPPHMLLPWPHEGGAGASGAVWPLAASGCCICSCGPALCSCVRPNPPASAPDAKGVLACGAFPKASCRGPGTLVPGQTSAPGLYELSRPGRVASAHVCSKRRARVQTLYGRARIVSTAVLRPAEPYLISLHA